MLLYDHKARNETWVLHETQNTHQKQTQRIQKSLQQQEVYDYQVVLRPKMFSARGILRVRDDAK